ncbi:Ribonuclease H-like superfamily [Sesbania bispinosa]|nr:Ribonuclease H-like superfamily [Sesbania bispinosa]
MDQWVHHRVKQRAGDIDVKVRNPLMPSIQHVIEAELIALMKGLHFAWENSFQKLICETDSLEVIHLITNYSEAMQSPFHDTLRLDRDWDVCVKHVFREANLVADRLAKLRNRGLLVFLF